MGPGHPAVQSVVMALLLSASIFVAAFLVPALSQSPGDAAVDYVDARASRIDFVWVHNCTVVNENLTQYYHESVGAYVDAVCFLFNESSPRVRVLFAPYSSGQTAECQITAEQWDDVRRNLFTYGVGIMDSAAEHPDYFPEPVSLNMKIYFKDNTVISLRYTDKNQLARIGHGTWTGLFGSDGLPESSSFGSESDWLDADGHLEYGVLRLYETITLAS